MESGGNNEGQGYSAVPQQQQPGSWSKSMGSPPPELQPKSSDGQIPIYFNTPSDAPISTATSPYPQPQKSPAVPQDHYRYQQHAPSPGPGTRLTHRMPGPYPTGTGWPSTSSPAPPHPPYMSPDRGRYNPPRPAYPGYDPSKPYSHPSQPGTPNQGPWQRPPYQSSHSGFTDPSRTPRFGHADIAGPIVPAGLQALQANNNNAALMQHQHTPMLVPNPHFNQTRAQQQGPPPQASEKPLEHSKVDHTPQRPYIPAPDGTIYPQSANPATPNFYQTQSPRPQQHGNLGPMHHPVGLSSPSASPYPTNPGTPGSTKSKARGNKSYQCPKCVKVFRRGDHLKRHLLSVHDHEHPYQCGECGKGFASVPTLLKHAKSLHIGNLAKGLMCLRCQLTFNTFQEMEAHAVSLHVQEDEMYMQNINTSSKQHCCTSCSKAFTSAANLKRHMQLLHKSKDDARMYCRECGKGFTRIDMMRKHVEKMHNGNPSAMPDELDDAETLSQEHSSESESRGPSQDADESSMSAPPSNNAWGGYPAPIAQHVDTRPAGHSHPPPAPPSSTTAFPAQFQSQLHSNGQLPNPDNGAVVEPSQQTIPPQTATVIPHPMPITSQKNLNSGSLAVQSHTAVIQSNNDVIPRELVRMASESNVTQTSNALTPLDKIEPKSVSEALSMAMKALSDSDYETPGFEMYPYPDEPPAPQPPALQYHRMHPQQQLLMAQVRNGLPPNVNGHRPHGTSSGMLPFMNNHNSYEFSSRQGGNFLMTMPPPPDSMSTGRLPPQPATAGVPEAPQLSRLLQGGGGGVKSPTVINNNNNSNAKRETQASVSRRGNSQIGIRNVSPDVSDDYEATGDFMHSQQEEKPDLSCKVCKIEYESIDGLMSHIEGVHLKQNPHECCICQKHFAQAGNVKRHIRFVHLRERPFRCKDCSCTFDRLCYLQRHMRTHLQLSEENQDFNPLKPCCCPECGKRCLTAHHLRGHMQRKHFAKNKQNYEEFLAKYGHLEALGTGPGAISQHSKGRKGRKRKELEKEMNGNGPIQHNRSFSDPMHNSSAMPDSSKQSSSLSKFPRYQCPPPLKIPPAIHLQSAPYSTLPQQHHDLSTQAKMTQNHLPNFQQFATTTTIPNFHDLPEFMTGQPEIIQSLSYPTPHRVSTTSSNIGMAAVHSQPQQNVAYNEPNLFEGFDLFCQMPEKNSTLKTSGSSNQRYDGKKRLPYRCRHCSLKSFATLEMLRSHLAVAHKSRPKLHICLKCGQSFGKRCNLRSHTSNVHKKIKKKTKHLRLATRSRTDSLQNTSVPFYQNQQLAPGYGQKAMCYAPPNQNFYGYDPNSPAMVPSPNVQVPYLTPTHFATAQMPLIQT